VSFTVIDSSRLFDPSGALTGNPVGRNHTRQDEKVFGVLRSGFAFGERDDAPEVSRPTPMQPTTWNTATVEQARRFDYYRSALCDSFAHLTPHKPPEHGSFSGMVEHWSGSSGEFTLMATSTHCVSRSRSDIAKVEDNHLYLNFIQRGEMKFEQFGSRYMLRPGDLVMIDNAQLFEAQINARGGHRHLAFRMDRQSMPGNAGEISERLTKHELTPVLRQTLAYLCRVNEEWTPDHLANVATAVRSLTSTILSEHAANPSQCSTTVDRVKEIISARMQDPEFSLDEVANSLKLSRRTVQKHLQAHHLSFSTMLLEARLEQAHRLMLRSSGRICAEEICFLCGFGEISTFYRAFKARFGVPPATYRNRFFSQL
jgi:AraC family transcriptional activator of tynA and feaB